VTTQPVSERHSSATLVDAQITASVKGLAASLDIKAEDLAEYVGINRATYYRRRKQGGWRATEVALIAARCRVAVEDIYAGRATANLTPDDDPPGGGVRHQGLEPRTRWFDGWRRRGHLSAVPELEAVA